MNDRAVTLVGAIVALVAVYALLGGGQQSRPPGDTRPHTEDRRGSGLAGLARWLEGEQVPVFSLRHRYDWLLLDAPVPATGNLLITSLPHFAEARAGESEYLAQWIGRGNSILVLAAFHSAPPWARTAFRAEEAWGINDLLPVSIETDWVDAATGGYTAGDDSDSAGDRPVERDTRYYPVGAHPLLQQVEAIHRDDDGEYSEYWNFFTRDRVTVVAPAPVLTLLAGDATYAAALWLTVHGRGRIIVSALPELFSNGQLSQPGHAQLAANIVNYGRDGGYVVFDDFHQGISAVYDPDAFFSDPRLYKSLAFLIGLWLVWLLGASSRFYLGESAAAGTPSRTAFIAATGGFLARSLRPATCAREMFSHFVADVRHTGRYRGDDDLLWRRLAEDVRARPGAVAELQTLQAGLDDHPRRVDLRRIHNLMRAIRKDLL